MAIEIVDLPTNSIVIFNSYVNVYQRVVQNVWSLEISSVGINLLDYLEK